MMLPTLIGEQNAHLFSFYLDRSVRQGLRYGLGLYGWVYSFPIGDRLAAFDLAAELGALGNQTVITVSQNSYKVWIELTSDSYPHWDSMIQAALTRSQVA